MPFSSFIDDQQIDEGYIDISEFSGDEEYEDVAGEYEEDEEYNDSDCGFCSVSDYYEW